MIFPFRTSTIFRNRWVALLWAAGICFMAAQVVDTHIRHDRQVEDRIVGFHRSRRYERSGGSGARQCATGGTDGAGPVGRTYRALSR